MKKGAARQMTVMERTLQKSDGSEQVSVALQPHRSRQRGRRLRLHRNVADDVEISTADRGVGVENGGARRVRLADDGAGRWDTTGAVAVLTQGCPEQQHGRLRKGQLSLWMMHW